jgi:hypothetical protein
MSSRLNGAVICLNVQPALLSLLFRASCRCNPEDYDDALPTTIPTFPTFPIFSTQITLRQRTSDVIGSYCKLDKSLARTRELVLAFAFTIDKALSFLLSFDL